MLDTFKNVVAATADEKLVELGGRMLGAEIELARDTTSLGNQVGEKVWVVCAIIIGA